MPDPVRLTGRTVPVENTVAEVYDQACTERGTMIRTDEIAIAYATARQVIRNLGREYSTGWDVFETDSFEDVWAELVANEKKGRVNDESSPFSSDINSGNASYIIVRDSAGVIRASVSVRRLDLQGSSLKTHLRRQFRRIYGGGREAIDPKRIVPVASKITGTVAFISDVFIDVPMRTKMPQGVMTILAQSLAALRWQPDWMYGFTKDRDLRRGLAAKYYAARTYPGAVKWLVNTSNRRDDDWLLCWDREDYAHVLRNFIDEFDHQWSVDRLENVNTS